MHVKLGHWHEIEGGDRDIRAKHLGCLTLTRKIKGVLDQDIIFVSFKTNLCKGISSASFQHWLRWNIKCSAFLEGDANNTSHVKVRQMSKQNHTDGFERMISSNNCLGTESLTFLVSGFNPTDSDCFSPLSVNVSQRHIRKLKFWLFIYNGAITSPLLIVRH